LWGAPLKIISGFPPPNFYSESPNGFGGGGTAAAAVTLSASGEVVGEPEHCPHGLACFHDYEEGLAYAKESGKPILLDFTGWACVNCRKMEEQVWSDPRVLQKLREDYVLISLYVDEKLDLPKEEQIEVTIGTKTKKLRTVGNKWSYFQATRFGTNSQPFYVVLDHDENQLGGPASYDPDIEKYVNWLDDGIAAFDAGK
jgi:thiol:disulfide interchange protein DsbD